eukprot:172741-Pyramimonas_sp.AAC.1
MAGEGGRRASMRTRVTRAQGGNEPSKAHLTTTTAMGTRGRRGREGDRPGHIVTRCVGLQSCE